MDSGSNTADLVILGAGAAGLFAAIAAASNGLHVAILDHARKPGRKIAISGGGRCNVTNTAIAAADYVCGNPHFVKSALARWTPQDMRQWLQDRGAPLDEEPGGKLFSRHGAAAVVQALRDEVRRLDVRLMLQSPVRGVTREGDGFAVATETYSLRAPRLLVATGGLAWPQLGATGLGHDLARQFGLKVTPRRPGLTPLFAPPPWLPLCRELAGLALPVRIAGPHSSIQGDMLFTHQGLSGPAILDASLFWKEGQTLAIDLLPDADLASLVRSAPRQELRNALARALPARLAAALCAKHGWSGQAGQCSNRMLASLEESIHRAPFAPAAAAGHDKAEVTLGGVDVARIDSKTMQCKDVPGLFFAGEVLDVTGRLGGFNLHWAWASGRAAGMACGAD
ncbi:BaiN/RdsA family NAD(P)/FAD-dependent oxidoreductase [Megalodesulfovibrio gigas]|uniref:Putative HI0933 family protein n=1 Tax=Megalodesulfovibrio gigas (strain ATCC 19364 / DSM 1382 / NCIMB 9332 / VKM B-1759) TaxID=1121448 RepID=T2GCU7_MEGG1|nr:aminoacetone oxidase family FAD-binding enzyme [Megalodesulfovibrio gigas]AGW13951.1 putative HI0933 family protein [Megalodesulfovibrio gigas DSM 1382 = ATCC 19364]